MNAPNLEALQQGDATAWDEAFHWLWPVAFAVAEFKLKRFFPGEIEDVAIEALEELVEKVGGIKKVEELKPLTASIAHHRAVTLLRERFAAKRGGGLTESLDALGNDGADNGGPASANTPITSLQQTELAELIACLQAELTLELRMMLNDFFIGGLSYKNIADKYGVAIGTVGVYLKRGLEAIRRQRTRHPKLLKELEGFLR